MFLLSVLMPVRAVSVASMMYEGREQWTHDRYPILGTAWVETYIGLGLNKCQIFWGWPLSDHHVFRWETELHGWSSTLMTRSYLFNKKEHLVIGTKYKGSTFCYRYLISCFFQSITLRLAYYYLCFTGLLSAGVSGYFKAGSEGSCLFLFLLLFIPLWSAFCVYVCVCV